MLAARALYQRQLDLAEEAFAKCPSEAAVDWEHNHRRSMLCGVFTAVLHFEKHGRIGDLSELHDSACSRLHGLTRAAELRVKGAA